MRRAALFLNLSLLLLYPIAWTAPLARAKILPFFSGTELTILGGIADLWETDVFLAAIVAVFAVFALMGLGLALPFLALSFAPGLHRFLPKPGAWMDRLKQFFAFPMFLTSIWLLSVLGDQAGQVGPLFPCLGQNIRRIVPDLMQTIPEAARIPVIGDREARDHEHDKDQEG